MTTPPLCHYLTAIINNLISLIFALCKNQTCSSITYALCSSVQTLQLYTISVYSEERPTVNLTSLYQHVSFNCRINTSDCRRLCINDISLSMYVLTCLRITSQYNTLFPFVYHQQIIYVCHQQTIQKLQLTVIFLCWHLIKLSSPDV